MELWQKPAARHAAQAVFLRAGYGASMDLVAAEAGVSKQTVYNHFGSKDALFRAIMAALGDEFLTVLDEQDVSGKEPRETLSRLAEHVVTLLLRPSMLGLHRMLVAEAPRFPDLARQVYAAGPGEGVRRLAAYLGEQDRRGVLRVPEPDLAAQQFLGALTGNIQLRALLDVPVSHIEALRSGSLRRGQLPARPRPTLRRQWEKRRRLSASCTLDFSALAVRLVFRQPSREHKGS